MICSIILGVFAFGGGQVRADENARLEAAKRSLFWSTSILSQNLRDKGINTTGAANVINSLKEAEWLGRLDSAANIAKEELTQEDSNGKATSEGELFILAFRLSGGWLETIANSRTETKALQAQWGQLWEDFQSKKITQAQHDTGAKKIKEKLLELRKFEGDNDEFIRGAILVITLGRLYKQLYGGKPDDPNGKALLERIKEVQQVLRKGVVPISVRIGVRSDFFYAVFT